MKQILQQIDDSITKLQEEYEYWYNCWNAKECNSGNCRLIGLAIKNLKDSKKLIKLISEPKTI